jgi:hypothetical protein
MNDGDVLKAVVSILAPEQVIGANVFYWRLDDPTPDNPSTAQILTALVTRCQAIYATVDQDVSDDYSFDEFTAEKIEWDGLKWETVENLGEGVIAEDGENVAAAAPQGVAAVVTAQTSRPQTRARKFIPGFNQNAQADSVWTAPTLTSLNAFATAWLTDQAVVGSAFLVPVVVSVAGPTAGTIFALVTGTVGAISGYQRRRKPGVGQ